MKTKLQSLFVVLALSAGVHPTPAQITNLGIAQAGNQSILFWPATVTNYVLQCTTNLATPNWVTVTADFPARAASVPNIPAGMFFRLVVYDGVPYTTDGMALVSAGSFMMGDSQDGESDATPPVIAKVSGFYMDWNLVSYSQWQSVYNWATTHGYSFYNAGAGKDVYYPVESVNWFDAVKWCNARSQQAGLTPVYYADAGFTQVFTNLEVSGTTVYPNWAAKGYRLPTEAEWEKAARGGLNGQRFPWGQTISENQANYYGDTNDYNYDMGPNGFNTAFDDGVEPYTSPVGSFDANGYGLYDMAGNVSEWCWDWYGTPYAGGTDPRGPGPEPGTFPGRVTRGGDWEHSAYWARCACRLDTYPYTGCTFVGFRCVRGL